MPDVRAAVQSAEHLDAAVDLGENESEDEQRLRHLDDGFSERRIPRAVWLSQRRRIELRIVERNDQ
jgi:hypothetical protein